MTVYLNGRFLTQPVTGVQRFAIEMGTRLLDLLPDLRVVVPPAKAVTPWPGEVTIAGRSAGHVWEQVDLPRFLWGRGRPLLLNLTNTGPAYYGNQVSTQHDINYVRHPESYSRAFRVVYAWVVPRLLKNSRAILTGTEHARADIVSHYAPTAPIHVVYDAASEIFRPPADSSRRVERYLLAVASTSAHKNLPRLYEAMGRLKGTEVPQLWVVGSGGRSFATADGGAAIDQSMVRFLGRVSDPELVELYQGAVAFVFPSLHEGFGIPPVEAQACGCPVVSSSASCLPEVLRDSCLKFDPYDIDSMVAAIRSVSTDEQLRSSLRAAGYENVQRFSWDRSAAQLAAILAALG